MSTLILDRSTDGVCASRPLDALRHQSTSARGRTCSPLTHRRSKPLSHQIFLVGAVRSRSGDYRGAYGCPVLESRYAHLDQRGTGNLASTICRELFSETDVDSAPDCLCARSPEAVETRIRLAPRGNHRHSLGLRSGGHPGPVAGCGTAGECTGGHRGKHVPAFRRTCNTSTRGADHRRIVRRRRSERRAGNCSIHHCFSRKIDEDHPTRATGGHCRGDAGVVARSRSQPRWVCRSFPATRRRSIRPLCNLRPAGCGSGFEGLLRATGKTCSRVRVGSPTRLADR